VILYHGIAGYTTALRDSLYVLRSSVGHGTTPAGPSAATVPSGRTRAFISSRRSKGYKATLVNGQLSVQDGEYTGTRAGMVLRHPN
jgi:N-acyl-D-aspartate/D-glutamate deacylase